MSRPVLSVIVPVYQAERVLTHLVRMLWVQTLQDWEAYFIDDGSRDKSAEVLSRMMRKDSRIRLVQQPNRGAASARNRGVKKARGETLTFVDADDYIAKDYFEYMYQIYNRIGGADWICVGHQDLHIGKQFSRHLMYGSVGCYNIFTKTFLEQAPLETVWAKLFNRNWFLSTGVLFNECFTVSEDTFLMNQLALQTRLVGSDFRYKGYGYSLPESGKSLYARNYQQYARMLLMTLCGIIKSPSIVGCSHRKKVISIRLEYAYQRCMTATRVLGFREVYQQCKEVFPCFPRRLYREVEGKGWFYILPFWVMTSSFLGFIGTVYGERLFRMFWDLFKSLHRFFCCIRKGCIDVLKNANNMETNN